MKASRSGSPLPRARRGRSRLVVLSKRATAVGGLVLASLGNGGCAETARQAAREATPAAAEGALDTARKPENRQDMAQILADPQIRQAFGALANSVANGAFDALTDEERLHVIEQLSERLVQRVVPALSKFLAADLGPAVAHAVGDSVDRAVVRLTSSENQERLAVFASTLSQSVVRAIAQQAALDVATLSGGAKIETAGNWVNALARSGGQGIALGFQDAVRETELRRQAGDKRPGDVLALAGRAADAGAGLLATSAAIASLAFGGLLGWFVWRARRYRRRSDEREEALLMLARVIKSTEGTALADELRERIREAAREHESGNTLRAILRQHADLRLKNRPEPTAAWHHS